LIRSLVLALGIVAAPALAQNQPESVYASFHRAGLAGDYDGMLKYGSAAHANDLPAAERKRLLRVLARVLPPKYAVVEKTVDEGGKRAVLRLRGTPPQAVLGTITLVKEKGEWKVDEANWAER
jgi:hypothetical protein